MSTPPDESDRAYPFLPRCKDGRTWNPDDFWDRYHQLLPSPITEPASPELVSLIEDALAKFPHSARLWCRLGLFLLGAESTIVIKSALECYQRALQADPFCGDAYEEIGFLYDLDDDPLCEAAFKLAVSCDGCLPSCLALAGKSAERGDLSAASQWLDGAAEWRASDIQEIADFRSKIEKDRADQSRRLVEED